MPPALLELSITGGELEVGDIIVNQFGALTVTKIVERTIYATRYETEFCRLCVCNNRTPLTVRRPA